MHIDIVDSTVAGSLAGSLDGPPLRRSVLNRLDVGLGPRSWCCLPASSAATSSTSR